MVQGIPEGSKFRDTLIYHEGIKATLKVNPMPHPSYDKGGIEALNNGRLGSSSRYGDSEWLGFWGEDIDMECILPQPVELNSINLRFFHAPGQWIYAPKEVKISIILENGETIQTLKKVNPKSKIVPLEIDGFDSQDTIRVKSLKINIPNYGDIPDGQQGAGNKAWTFIDEIVIK